LRGVAVKKSIVGKALASLKAVANVSVGRGLPDGSSEKVVEVPAVRIFTELPFGQVGSLGGTGVNVISSPALVRWENAGTPLEVNAARAGKKASSSVNPGAKTCAGTKKTTTSPPAKKTRKKT
jgi:hypothetical protein